MIREMAVSDAAVAAELSAELGYPVPLEAMGSRLQALASLRSHAVFAACFDGRVVGWVDVGIVHHLQSGSYGEIGGLVVSQQYRGRGIGKQLVARAEAWIANQQVGTVLVRSQIAREAAHEFYLRLDYTRLKTSAVFTKILPGHE